MSIWFQQREQSHGAAATTADAPEAMPLLASVAERPHTGGMRILSRVLPALAILLLLYIAFVRLEATAWLFRPAPYPGGDWSVQRIYDAQDHWIPFGNSRLHAWLVPTDRPVRTVLFFHSRQGNVSDQAEHILRQRDLRSNTLLVDYPGYGKSPGTPSVATLDQVGEASYQYLVKQLHVPPSKLIVQGDELGTAVAAHVAATHPQVAGLILESPFPDLHHLANAVLPMAGWFMSGDLNELHDVQSYPGPVLVMYGSRDPNLPASLSQQVVQSIRGPKTTHVVEGGTQAELILLAGDDYSHWIGAFYQTTGTAVRDDKPAKEEIPYVPIRR